MSGVIEKMAGQEGGINISVEEIRTKESPTMQRVVYDDPGSNNNRAEVEITIQTVEVEHLHKVPKRLEPMEPFLKLFEPRVVSLGPYHHYKKKLQVTVYDKCKIKDGLLHNKGKKAEDFDQQEMNLALKDARDFYVGYNMISLIRKDFNEMMILDACFIIHIMDYIANKKETGLGIKLHLLPLVVEEIFLLENQVPFAVLKSAMTLLGIDAEIMTRKFLLVLNLSTQVPSARRFSDKMVRILKVIMRYSVYRRHRLIQDRNFFWNAGKHVHLLQILRADLLGYAEEKQPAPQPYLWYPIRCATELKASGINFQKIESWIFSLEDVRFEEGFIFGQLFLPSVNQMTKRRLLNLIAYELSLKHCGYGIISYVSFLDGLIDSPEDVKELRSKNILPKDLGSDDEVARFFNMVGANLVPNPLAYHNVLQGIDTHCRNTWRADIAEIHHKYFGSSSAIISFFIAAFVLLITVAQAYTAFFPIKN